MILLFWMNKISKRSLLTAFLISFVLLYVLSGLGAISANSQVHPYSIIFLLIIHLFCLSSSTYFMYSLLGTLKSPYKLVILFFASFVVIPLAYYTMNPPLPPYGHEFLSPLYIIIGDPLRDTYGINWYWMDWGGWMQCVLIYFTLFYLFLTNYLITIFHHLQKTNLLSDPKDLLNY